MYMFVDDRVSGVREKASLEISKMVMPGARCLVPDATTMEGQSFATVISSSNGLVTVEVDGSGIMASLYATEVLFLYREPGELDGRWNCGEPPGGKAIVIDVRDMTESHLRSSWQRFLREHSDLLEKDPSAQFSGSPYFKHIERSVELLTKEFDRRHCR